MSEVMIMIEPDEMIQDLYVAYRGGYQVGRHSDIAVPASADFAQFLEARYPHLVPYYNLKVIAEVM